MSNPDPVIQTETQIKPGERRALKHGGEAAVKAIQKGQPMTGPAREAELAVYEELETAGRHSLVRRNAARLQAAADLYWGAISKLMQDVNERGGIPADVVIVKLDKYIKRFGWLAGASLRAWEQVKQDEKDSGPGLVADYEEMLSEEHRFVG